MRLICESEDGGDVCWNQEGREEADSKRLREGRGQRHVELRTSFTVAEDGSAVLHVSQLPPNPAILGESGSSHFDLDPCEPCSDLFSLPLRSAQS